MRVDHLAYQRALNITVFGLLLQSAVGAVLLVFGLAVDDAPSVFAAMWCIVGLIPWIGLLVVFAQHRLERLEALEEDELSGSGAAALFERSGEAIRPAARRLRQTYRWILPGFSVAFALGLAIAGWLMLAHLRSEDLVTMPLTGHLGWLEAIVLAGAALSFVCSRYLAGMGAQESWRHLRAGAGQMGGVSLILAALAIGVGFRFFEVDGVVQAVAWAIPVLMFAAAIEVILSIVLNAYRPRRAGEFPRASFDSPTLSLFAQPGSVVRSINEAVNYQFGFDITSSWGYQLLLRSSLSLGGLAIVVLLLMSTVVVVGPREEGLRLRSGAIVGSAESSIRLSGPFLKWPWPIETSQVWDVTTLRTLPVTPIPEGNPRYHDWRNPPKLAGGEFEPAYIVRPSSLGDMDAAADDQFYINRQPFALVVPDVRLVWRVHGDALLQYLHFVPDAKKSRQTLTQQQRSLQMIANAEMTRIFAGLRLDQVLSTDRNDLGRMLMKDIQSRLDVIGTGIELVAVEVPDMRPPKDAAIKFESLPAAVQQRQQWVATAQRNKVSRFTRVVGDGDLVDSVIAAIEIFYAKEDALLEARDAHGKDSAEVKAATAEADKASAEVLELLRKGGGQAWQTIANAERDSWLGLMRDRIQASRLKSQEASWNTAPSLYRQRAIMEVYARMLPNLRKYVVDIDPSRLDLNVELREHASPNTVFSDAVSSGGSNGTEGSP